MKKLSIYAFAFLSVLGLYSCKKNAVQEIDVKVTSGAQVRFFNFSVNAPLVNFYANDTKVTAGLSATGKESTTAGVAYGSVGPTNNYALITPGSYSFKGVTPSTATTNPNTAISSLTATVAEGKYYSYYLSGLYSSTTKTSDAFILEDNFPAIDTATAYVRFVHASANIKNLNFVIKNTNTSEELSVASNIAYKNGSVFVKVANGVYDLFGRYSATPTANFVTRTNVSFVKGKVYTITMRGDESVPASILLDNTADRKSVV